MTRSKKEKQAEQLIEGISIGTIKRWRNLSGTWNFFRFSTKEDFDAAGITDLQMVQYIKSRGEANEAAKEAWAQEQAKALELYREDRAKWEEETESREENLEQEKDRKIAQYLEDFEAPKKSDIDNLKNLAEAQLRLEDIHRDRRHQMALPLAVKMLKESREVFSSLADEEKGLLQQVRQLQKSMGIDRPTREDKAAEVTGVDKVKQIVQEAKEFLANEITEVHHCGIRTVWIADFFRENYCKIVKQCPRCGGLIAEEFGVLEWRNDIPCPLGCDEVLVKGEGWIGCRKCGWKCCIGKGVEIKSQIGG